MSVSKSTIFNSHRDQDCIMLSWIYFFPSLSLLLSSSLSQLVEIGEESSGERCQFHCPTSLLGTLAEQMHFYIMVKKKRKKRKKKEAQTMKMPHRVVGKAHKLKN